MRVTPTLRKVGDLVAGTRRRALVAVSIYTVSVSAILWLFGGLPTVVRIPLALPLLLFTPGYAVLSAVLPATHEPPSEPSGRPNASRVPAQLEFSAIERGVVAMVLSVAIVPMVALVVNAIVGISIGPILAGLCLSTVVASGVGLLRYREVSSSAHPIGQGRTGIFERDWWAVISYGVTPIAIVVVLILLTSSGVLLAADSGAEQPRTEFYLENKTESEDVHHLLIVQHSDTSQQYTLVVMSCQQAGDERRYQAELDRFSVEVGPDELEANTYRAPPTESDADAALCFLLYRDVASPDPDEDSAHRALRVSVNQTAPAESDIAG